MSPSVIDETENLKRMVQQQLQRLICQMKDLDELRADLTDEEYRETKAETMKEMKQFEDSLDRMIAGDMTLQDDLSAMKLALHAAFNESFKTPEIIRMFASKQTSELRQELEKLKERYHLKNITKAQYEEKTVEILTALKSLNEELTDEEAAFFSKQMSQKFNGFQQSFNKLNKDKEAQLVSQFGKAAQQK